jgi:thymidylate synthase ThyX
MKVNVLAIRPPKTDEPLREVTPELLASSLAKYSRSNKGIDSILETIDWNDPDASVDKIFKFVDYGHASIGGMTGGIAITVDDCSMFLAYKIFEICNLVDGQESSTRYITMKPESLLDPEEIGIPEALRDEWSALMKESFELYEKHYNELDAIAKEHPELMRIPADTPPKVADRIRKNYALDRARYFIPLATKTSAAYIMTARVWADVIKTLASYNIPECKKAADMIRAEVSKIAPRLMKHSYPDDASSYHANVSAIIPITAMAYNRVPFHNLKDKTWLKVDDDFPSFIHEGTVDHFAYKSNRYSTIGSKLKRTTARFAFNNIAIAELRDLNRHRTGYRYTDFIPVGFYLPPELEDQRPIAFFERWSNFMNDLCQTAEVYTNNVYMYAYFLGTQVAFEHTTNLDKLIYEIELRTGLGAHFRYAEHLEAVATLLISQRPEYERHISIGTAEPE